MEQKKKEGGLGDDLTVALEKEISVALIERGREMLGKIVTHLDSGCDPVRVFRLLENIAKHHRELIAALHGGDSFHKKFGFGSTGGLGSEDMYPGMNQYGNQEENFGAQALKGLVEGLKKPRNKSGEIADLTEALDRTYSRSDDPKMRALTDKLQKHLDCLLDDRIIDKIIPLGTIDLPGGVEAEVEIADIPTKEETDE